MTNKNSLDEKKIKKGLSTLRLGKDLEVFDTIDSTNSYAKALSEDKKLDGTVIVANEQTAGRGRTSRKFFSSKDGVYLSFILKPDHNNFNVGLLTLAVALSVKKALTDISGLDLEIKWPNDILFGDKKLCGILSEAQTDALNGKVKYIICGIGINCNNTFFPDEISDIAVSLRQACGKAIDKNELLIKLLYELDNVLYRQPYYINPCDMLLEYKKSLTLLGKQVSVIYPEYELCGIAKDIDLNGGLIVSLPDGEQKSIFSGEVKLRVKA